MAFFGKRAWGASVTFDSTNGCIFSTKSTLTVMAKEKLKLNDLQVQSFITSLGADQLGEVKGGLKIISVNGKKSNYKVRWTSLDTRLDPDEHIKGSGGSNQ